ncbi:pilus assembly protein CpaF [Lachnospiraceae bacterium NK3A20]|jgi:pilus assembly protein CpaF|nr:pilus assembly protein CpaF [Lachnospiraceae bacterium NK3A20]
MAGLLELLNEQKLKETLAREPDKESPQHAETGDGQPDGRPAAEVTDPYAPIRDKLQKEAIHVMNENPADKKGVDRATYVRQTVTVLLQKEELPLTISEKQQIVDSIVSNIIGLGPLDPLIQDDSISEIMVNGPEQVYVEKKGRLYLTGTKFQNDAQVMTVLDRIVSPLGRHVDESSPMVDARLPDGSRVNAIIPPLALNGPTITIRKFPKESISVRDLIGWKSASPRMMMFLEACVRSKLNIIISGGTGSGKTTLLGVLSAYIPDNERIVTIEDAAELRLQQSHVVRLEARPANIEGRGRIAIKDLVVNALRMRPDRIIVGECRGGEALDMLQAMNTGHDGSLTTGHANGPRDMMSRLETMVMMSGMELPSRAIREQIASAINIVVQQSRLADGSRKIVSISEITGMEKDEIVMQEIYRFNQKGIDENGRIVGTFNPTGIRPKCMSKLKLSGMMITDDWFDKRNE